ncbi:hypothetical protein [Streptomyces violascens]|uniref:hypothetical protein n=1 Tax=Streptomyces violascens TaxID=67381 RepID=UPI00364C34EB
MQEPEDYDDAPVDLGAVSDVYALLPLSQELGSSLNAELTLADPAEDIAEIGCPGPGWGPNRPSQWIRDTVLA